MQKERFKVPVAVYLIVKNGNRILLQLRKNTGYMDGYYSLVAGHIEGNETATQACIREANEEAGMELKASDIKPVHIMHRLTPKTEYIDMFFIVENYNGNIENREPEKHEKHEFFDIDNLPENIIDYIKVAINKAMDGVFYSEYGFKD